MHACIPWWDLIGQVLCELIVETISFKRRNRHVIETFSSNHSGFMRLFHFLNPGWGTPSMRDLRTIDQCNNESLFLFLARDWWELERTLCYDI